VKALEKLAGEDENALLGRVALMREYPTVADLTPESVRGITGSHGVDFATALLYNRLSREERNRSFVTRIDRLQTAKPRAVPDYARRRVSLAIVPAAFYKEKPHSGADGRVIRAAAARLGLSSEVVPVQSTGTPEQNSAILVDWLMQHAGRKIILISLCKGGADVKFALSKPGAQKYFEGVPAWISVCGTLNGSPVAEWLLRTRIRTIAAWMVLRSGGHDLAFLREVVPSPGSPLSAPLALPPGTRLITIVGFPLRRHLSNGFMRRCHTVLSDQGPNDGGILLADVCRLPGVVYPVWGADHYLRPDERAERIIAAVLSDLVGEPLPESARTQEELCPSN
jgi:hypothetical protein